ncbi:MAG: class-II fumarase/aspartase family protein [Acidimicrobiales bacterium]
MPGELFGPIVCTDEVLDATSDRAWVRALLDAESALARAEAEVGVIPVAAAEAIAVACAACAAGPAPGSGGPAGGGGDFDAARLGREARGGGNPVIPLVRALSGAVAPEGRDWVHWGATSQDIMDTAAMLVSCRTVALIEADLEGLAGACAGLAETHRATLMVGRTLLQPALPVTFGLECAGWLGGVTDARAGLARVRSRLAAQLGGAAGTLASLGAEGPAVMARFAAHLGLAEPVLVWHTARQRVAELASALAIAAGTAAKIAGDVALLMQAEVGEVAEPAAPGRGVSSTLPHKRNPVAAAAVGAAARQAYALVPVLLSALGAEHQRALSAWPAEWGALTELLALAGGAVARTRETVAGLEVHPEAMAANLARTGGAVMAERISLALAPILGRQAAKDAVAGVAARAASSGRSLAEELGDDPAVVGAFGPGRLPGLLDPAGYLGATDAWIDRALAAHARACLAWAGTDGLARAGTDGPGRTPAGAGPGEVG